MYEIVLIFLNVAVFCLPQAKGLRWRAVVEFLYGEKQSADHCLQCITQRELVVG